MNKYLTASKIIDSDNKIIQSKAKELSFKLVSHIDIAKECFLFVRDKIKHSNDYKLNPVTCKASDVLKYETGYCYAKSHLLAALLRANNIPAGLCYQRLTINNNNPPFCLHGLNAVYLPKYGWYRLDARGNKKGVNASFTPPIECLAFPIYTKGEMDFQGVFSEPLPEVINILNSSNSFEDVTNNLPDIDIINTELN